MLSSCNFYKYCLDSDKTRRRSEFCFLWTFLSAKKMWWNVYVIFITFDILDFQSSKDKIVEKFREIVTRVQNCFDSLVSTEQKLVLFWQTDCSKTCLGIPRRIKPHKFQLLLAEESPSAPPHTSKTAFLGENVAFLSTI